MGELDCARALLADLEREQDGLAAEELLFRNAIVKMAKKLTSVEGKRSNVVRELGGKQDCLVNKVPSLQNNIMKLMDELARVAGGPGRGAQRHKGNAGGCHEGAR